MQKPVKGAALMVLGFVSFVGCRDWDQFEPLTGGGNPIGGNNAGAGNVGAGDLGGGPEGAGNQGGGPVGGGPVGGSEPTCGKIDILSDDFDQPLDWRWAGDNEYVSVSGGDLVVPHPAQETYFQLETSAGFDFRGRTMVLELSVPPGPGASLWWNIAGDTQNYLEFYIDNGGTLHLNYEKDDNLDNIAPERPFDPIEHRFQRFREENGTAYYDVSPDGETWTELGDWQLDDVFDPAFTSVYIGGGTDGVTAPDGDMHIARIYAEAPEASAPCAMTSFSDDFDDDARASAWYKGWYSSACPIGESGGALRVSCAADIDESSGYVSTSAYDLRGSSVSVEIVDPPESGSSGYMALGVARPESDTFYQFEVNDGALFARRFTNSGGTDLLSAAYDNDKQRFLRIREANGLIVFETSPDGSTYDTFHSESPPFDLSELLVFAMGGAYYAAAPVDLAFDNLNVGGPD